MDNSIVSHFLAGSQKTASTWIYRCLKEHPEIFVTDRDASHFFTVNYYKGVEWYHSLYRDKVDEEVVFDTTPSYIRDEDAARRIYEYNPNAKLVFNLRNPIDRAFSHYWHEKHKGKINFEFSEAVLYSGIGNFDLYQNWIKSGFYYKMIAKYLEYFGRDNVLILVYEDLKKDSVEFIQNIYRFSEVDDSFIPKSAQTVINKAGKPINQNKNPDQSNSTYINKITQSFPASIGDPLRRVKQRYLTKHITTSDKSVNDDTTEYERGVDPKIREILRKIFKPENEKLAEAFNLNLDHWV
ncbi:MAG: sulfotransferase domain-containing protein [Bacteroidota bacterium]